MTRHLVDLADHLNRTVIRGHPADFPVSLVPVDCVLDGARRPIPHRLAVVRDDTGDPLAVVSDRYALVRHQQILDAVDAALEPLDIGPVPCGIYVDRHGARMRAVYKFPTLAQPVTTDDEICPCLQIKNTYDGTTRVTISIGAFRFVCTNLAVGGGGIFAGGFMAVHAGEIPIAEATDQLATYLGEFDRIVHFYREWSARPLGPEVLRHLFEEDLDRRPQALWRSWQHVSTPTVYAAYNVATSYATHGMRSATAAFELMARVNRAFQRGFPPAS